MDIDKKKNYLDKILNYCFFDYCGCDEVLDELRDNYGYTIFDNAQLYQDYNAVLIIKNGVIQFEDADVVVSSCFTKISISFILDLIEVLDSNYINPIVLREKLFGHRFSISCPKDRRKELLDLLCYKFKVISEQSDKLLIESSVILDEFSPYENLSIDNFVALLELYNEMHDNAQNECECSLNEYKETNGIHYNVGVVLQSKLRTDCYKIVSMFNYEGVNYYVCFNFDMSINSDIKENGFYVYNKKDLDSLFEVVKI